MPASTSASFDSDDGARPEDDSTGIVEPVPRRLAATVSGLPFLTDTPGIGGRLRAAPEDFFVEEIPLYELSGEGEHLFLEIEKRELSTPELTRHVARLLQIRPVEIGTAGRKDRTAITRQYISVPARCCPDSSRLETEFVTVLNQMRHGNKLRTGHLKGNRFRIILREVPDGSLDAALRTKLQLEARGVPNYYGEQRFGARNNTDEDGFRILRGERARLRKEQKKFALSAAQSRLFNEWAARRIADGLGSRLIPGDFMLFPTSRGGFQVADVPAEEQRWRRRETTLSGPIFGAKTERLDDEAGQREADILRDYEIDPAAFAPVRKLMPGTRRPFLIHPDDFTIHEVDGGIEFQFILPAGAYATSVLREFQKRES